MSVSCVILAPTTWNPHLDSLLSSRCCTPRACVLDKNSAAPPCTHRPVFWILVSYLIATPPLSTDIENGFPFQRSHCNQLSLSEEPLIQLSLSEESLYPTVSFPEESLWKLPSNRMTLLILTIDKRFAVSSVSHPGGHRNTRMACESTGWVTRSYLFVVFQILFINIAEI